jgi:hypothetical protein
VVAASAAWAVLAAAAASRVFLVSEGLAAVLKGAAWREGSREGQASLVVMASQGDVRVRSYRRASALAVSAAREGAAAARPAEEEDEEEGARAAD